MKKLVLFFAVAAAVSFAACTNKPAEATEEAVETVAIEATCDSCKVACDSCTVACDSCKVACDSCKVACDSCKVAE